jgi:tRNA-binding EMAP/Myf-like protein
MPHPPLLPPPTQHQVPLSPWTCEECCCENEAAVLTCEGCELPRPRAKAPVPPPSSVALVNHGCLARVLSVEPIRGARTLHHITVDIGEWNGFDPMSVVTCAQNVVAGDGIAVVTRDGCVRASRHVDPEDVVEVQLRTIAGIRSAALVCDSSMLGWTSDEDEEDEDEEDEEEVGGTERGEGLTASLAASAAPTPPPPSLTALLALPPSRGGAGGGPRGGGLAWGPEGGGPLAAMRVPKWFAFEPGDCVPMVRPWKGLARPRKGGKGSKGKDKVGGAPG